LSQKIVKRGTGELIGWHDPDEQRRWISEHKSKELKDKRVPISTAVASYVHDGDFIAMGGFGHDRVSMVSVYEIIRQRKRHLVLAGKTAVHDSDLLIAAGCVDKIEVAYAFGHELRGLSPASRREVESGRVKVAAELSNAAYQWRFKAAAMGLPFMPCRVMIGSDTFNRSSSMIIEDPFSKKPICLVPACYPDVAAIHVHRCDMYGNCQIDGITIEDLELARAARSLIITTEEIIPNDRIRSEPCRTNIPFFLVDAVVEAPFGCHPGNMPGLYYFDEDHISEWLSVSKTSRGAASYLDKYVYGMKDFESYLKLVGGVEKMNRLRDLELIGSRPAGSAEGCENQ
jgi:acyl CoA:acetate/3-ketoacid CoA transferase alpha subunit